MSVTERAWSPSFWQLQVSGWAVMYILLLVAALPHLTERDILRYNTSAWAILFCVTLLIRPVCRTVSARWLYSWLALEGCAFVFSLLMGSLVTFVAGLGTFGWTRLSGSNWMVSGVQSAMVLFLWCSLSSASRTGNRRNWIELPNQRGKNPGLTPRDLRYAPARAYRLCLRKMYCGSQRHATT